MVAAVCSELGFYLTSTGKTVPSTFPTDRIENPEQADSEISQITLNTEARDALKDLFPNMPDKDLNQIIKTAFQKVRISPILIGEKNEDVENLISKKGSEESWDGHRIAFGPQSPTCCGCSRSTCLH